MRYIRQMISRTTLVALSREPRDERICVLKFSLLARVHHAGCARRGTIEHLDLGKFGAGEPSAMLPFGMGLPLVIGAEDAIGMTNDRVRLDGGPDGRILDTAIMRVKRRPEITLAGFSGKIS
jgi:hypothetical protein